MSSSNLVRLAFQKELVYGVQNPPGPWDTLRKTSESLSGTPATTESEEARDDRQSGGQVQVGLSLGGDSNYEISAADCYKEFILSGMKAAAWSAASVYDEGYSISGSTITGDGVGDMSALFSVGDMVRLTGATAANNNTMVYITAVTATDLTVIGRGLTNEAGIIGDIIRPPYAEIGQTDTSFTIEKNFLDLTNKSILYLGMLVDGLAMNFSYGAIANGTFTMVGSGYETPAVPVTNGQTVTPATSEIPINATSDVGLVILDGMDANFCIQTLNVSVANNGQAEECIGEIAPVGYAQGSAAVSITMSAYLADENFDYIEKKIEQTPVEIAYFAENQDGGVAVHVYEAQLSFDDPSSQGRDQIVSLDMTGTGKYSSTYGNTMRIYFWQAADLA